MAADTYPIKWSNLREMFRRVAGYLSDIDDRIDASSSGGLGLFKAVAAGTENIANLQANISWTEVINTASDVSLVIAGGATVEIETTGTYRIIWHVQTVSNNRTELILQVRKDTGSGFADIADAIASDYVARDADQDTGGCSLVTYQALNDGDQLRFRAEGDCDGTCRTVVNGTTLVIERVA